MAFCEDYPCCGHTDGLGCDYTPDMDYIWKHAACDHENNDCVLYGGYDDEEVDPEDCEHGDASYRTRAGSWCCDICLADLVMVTDVSPLLYPSKVVPGMWVEIPVLGWHLETAS